MAAPLGRAAETQERAKVSENFCALANTKTHAFENVSRWDEYETLISRVTEISRVCNTDNYIVYWW